MDPMHFGELDWREQLLRAVAYRITERERVEFDTGRVWVRDVMKHGANSKYFGSVSGAIQEMFTPLVGTFLPLVPQMVRVVTTIVEQENIRGSRAEVRILAEQARER